MLGVAGLAALVRPGAVQATHEIDHRFTVEGYVCGADGHPVPEIRVSIRDTRASIGAAAYTDSRGYYKAVLHLHNENRDDPIAITASEEEKRVAADFDPKDVRTERKVRVNFGSGCASAEQPAGWVYYGLGFSLVAAAVLVATIVRKKRSRRFQRRGKGQRKQSQS
jgi:hypothetical protein